MTLYWAVRMQVKRGVGKMAKFKAGDKVQCTNKRMRKKLGHNRIYTVVSCGEHVFCVEGLNMRLQYTDFVHSVVVEGYGATKPTPAPKVETATWQPGDLVLYNGAKDIIISIAEIENELNLFGDVSTTVKALLKSGAEVPLNCLTTYTEPTYNWSQIDDQYWTKYGLD